MGVMEKDALSFGADLLRAHRMRNLTAKHPNFVSICIPQESGNFLCKIGSIVHHGEQNPVNLQFGIELTLYLSNGRKQLLQTFCR